MKGYTYWRGIYPLMSGNGETKSQKVECEQ